MKPQHGIVLLLVSVLAACSTSGRYEVTRFHQLTEPEGETVRFVPGSEQIEEGLQFHEFAEMVGSALGRHGFEPGAGAEDPDYTAKLSYGVTQGPTYRGGSPVNVGVGVGSHGGSTSVGLSTAFNFGSNDYQYFTRWMRLVLVRNTDGEIVYEGTVDSTGRDRSLSNVMPFLVQAMFTDFPGESGTTKTVRIEDTY